MTRGLAQAGNRASKTGRYLQWWENKSEWRATSSAARNSHNSARVFVRLPLTGAIGPLRCSRPGGPRLAAAAITRSQIERKRAGPQSAQRPCLARDAPSKMRGQREKEFVTLLDLCVSSLRRGHANLLCIVPILTDDPRRESEILRHRNLNRCLTSALRKVGGAVARARRRPILNLASRSR